MARPLRIQYAGARYHLMSRGDRRELIFLDEKENDAGTVLIRAPATFCSR
jgi:putative transposase